MKKAFTLLELIIVVMIMGILISIALPRFQSAQEKAKIAEAYRVLGMIRDAQERYYISSSSSKYSSSISYLDIYVPTMRFYVSPPTAVNCLSFLNMTCVVGWVQRNDEQNPGFGNYYLLIQKDGEVYCYGGLLNCCEAIGIPRKP